jgi:hypothetical protein
MSRLELLVRASLPAFNPSESFFDKPQVALVSHGVDWALALPGASFAPSFS